MSDCSALATDYMRDASASALDLAAVLRLLAKVCEVERPLLARVERNPALLAESGERSRHHTVGGCSNKLSERVKRRVWRPLHVERCLDTPNALPSLPTLESVLRRKRSANPALFSLNSSSRQHRTKTHDHISYRTTWKVDILTSRWYRTRRILHSP